MMMDRFTYELFIAHMARCLFSVCFDGSSINHRALKMQRSYSEATITAMWYTYSPLSFPRKMLGFMKLSWKTTEEKIRADWSLWMKVSPPPAGVYFVCSVYRLPEFWGRLSRQLKSCWFCVHRFCLIEISAEWMTVLFKNTSLLVFLEIRSVLLIDQPILA